jgi:hypothetical protein
VAVALIVLAALAVALVVASLGGKETVVSTSASTREGSSPSQSSTSLPAMTTSTAAASTKGATVYNALLSGQTEIPPVSTSASGNLKLTVAADGSWVDYVLTVTNITDVTVARLRQGTAGTSGPTIFTLLDGLAGRGVHSGILAQGALSSAALKGPLQGKKLADLVALIRSGQVYLNVGTSTHTGGEIRGQVK